MQLTCLRAHSSLCSKSPPPFQNSEILNAYVPQNSFPKGRLALQAETTAASLPDRNVVPGRAPALGKPVCSE